MLSGISKLHVQLREEIKEIFETLDANADGSVSTDELWKNKDWGNWITRMAGLGFTKEEVKQAIKEADSDNSGTLELEEFEKVIFERMQEVDLKEEVIQAFRVFDAECNDTITCQKIKQALKSWFDDITDTEIQIIMKDIDPNQSGSLDFLEYVNKNWHTLIDD